MDKREIAIAFFKTLKVEADSLGVLIGLLENLDVKKEKSPVRVEGETSDDRDYVPYAEVEWEDFGGITRIRAKFSTVSNHFAELTVGYRSEYPTISADLLGENFWSQYGQSFGVRADAVASEWFSLFANQFDDWLIRSRSGTMSFAPAEITVSRKY